MCVLVSEIRCDVSNSLSNKWAQIKIPVCRYAISQRGNLCLSASHIQSIKRCFGKSLLLCKGSWGSYLLFTEWMYRSFTRWYIYRLCTIRPSYGDSKLAFSMEYISINFWTLHSSVRFAPSLMSFRKQFRTLTAGLSTTYSVHLSQTTHLLGYVLTSIVRT